MSVRILRRSNARRITATRKTDGSITITVPSWMSRTDWQPVADRLISQLAQTELGPWESRFHDGQRIECGPYSILIVTQSDRPESVIVRKNGMSFIIGKGSDLPWGTRSTDLAINALALRVARAIASETLIPEAVATAARLNVKVSGWKIGTGHKTLGTCRSDGRITLSAICVFLPAPLRNFIICHELAHRSEMNHSPRFHSICNHYLEGEEKMLSQQLKHFKWPIIR